jgi:hypothetical protein
MVITKLKMSKSKTLVWSPELAQEAKKTGIYHKITDLGKITNNRLGLNGAKQRWKTNPTDIYLPQLRVVGSEANMKLFLKSIDKSNLIDKGYTISSVDGPMKAEYEKELQELKKIKENNEIIEKDKKGEKLKALKALVPTSETEVKEKKTAAKKTKQTKPGSPIQPPSNAPPVQSKPGSPLKVSESPPVQAKPGSPVKVSESKPSSPPVQTKPGSPTVQAKPSSPVKISESKTSSPPQAKPGSPKMTEAKPGSPKMMEAKPNSPVKISEAKPVPVVKSKAVQTKDILVKTGKQGKVTKKPILEESEENEEKNNDDKKKEVKEKKKKDDEYLSEVQMKYNKLKDDEYLDVTTLTLDGKKSVFKHGIGKNSKKVYVAGLKLLANTADQLYEGLKQLDQTTQDKYMAKVRSMVNDKEPQQVSNILIKPLSPRNANGIPQLTVPMDKVMQAKLKPINSGKILEVPDTQPVVMPLSSTSLGSFRSPGRRT